MNQIQKLNLNSTYIKIRIEEINKKIKRRYTELFPETGKQEIKDEIKKLLVDE